ncbi:hypothetical protein Trydic_g12085 [Trypoxylus dichotomus]
MSTATAIFTPTKHEFNYVNSNGKLRNENTPEEFSLEEIADHDNVRDCWIVVYDRIYDITGFIKEHPGGADVLLEHAGRDATIAFRSTGHSSFAIKALEKYYVGNLPIQQRIFRKPGGFVVSNIPV